MEDKNKGLKIALLAAAVGFVSYLLISSKKKEGVVLSDDLTKRQSQIYNLIKSRDRVRMPEILKVVKNVSERTVRRDLTSLEKGGYISKIGNTKSSEYIVNNG